MLGSWYIPSTFTVVAEEAAVDTEETGVAEEKKRKVPEPRWTTGF